MMDKNLATYLFFNETIYSPNVSKKKINFKKVVLLMATFSEQNKRFFDKIAKAIELDAEDIQIQSEVIDYQEIKVSKKVEKILLFGITPQQIGIAKDFQKYKFEEFNGIQILQVDTLDNIELNENNEKFLLWQELQKMFLKK